MLLDQILFYNRPLGAFLQFFMKKYSQKAYFIDFIMQGHENKTR